MKIKLQTALSYTSLILVSVVLGYAIISQVKVESKIDEIIDPKRSSLIAIEVSELIKSNQKLLQEQKELQNQNNKLASSESESQESIENDIEKLKIINGETAVFGPGVTIEFQGFLQTVQIIDLINALRNIGADSMAINRQRVVANTYLNEEKFPPPVIIEVIGDSNILENALTRKGGIIEQIGGNANVTAQKELQLLAK